MNNVIDQVSTNNNQHQHTDISTTSADAVISDDVCDETDCESHSRLVPVSEAIKYRKRAQTAEQQLRELGGNLKTLELDLENAHRELSYMENKQRINELLCSAHVIDPDLARLAVEDSIKNTSEPDLKSVVSELKRRKPFLFHTETEKEQVQGSMTAAPRLQSRSGKSLRHHLTSSEAAQQAIITGKQEDLLRYMQLRRMGKRNGSV